VVLYREGVREKQFSEDFAKKGINGQILAKLQDAHNFTDYGITDIFMKLEPQPIFMQQMKESGYTCFLSSDKSPPPRFVTCKAKRRLTGKGPKNLVITAWFDQLQHLQRAQARFGF